MIRAQVSVGSATTSTPIPVNADANQFQVGFGVTLGGGTMTFKVQHTFDNIYDPAVTPVWFDHAVVTGKSADTSDSYLFPITAIRLNVTAYTSGTAILKILQGGN